MLSCPLGNAINHQLLPPDVHDWNRAGHVSVMPCGAYVIVVDCGVCFLCAQINIEDIGGVQSMTAMLLLSVMFTGVVNMNTSLNAVYALRAAYYR